MTVTPRAASFARSSHIRLVVATVAALVALGVTSVRVEASAEVVRLDGPLLIGVAGVAGATRGAMPLPDASTCPATVHGAVVDRAVQRAWLCDAGTVVRVMPMTSAVSQPDPGVYAVYAEDPWTTSSLGPRPSVLDHFVAFSRGENRGARIGFHAVPRYADDTLAQPLETVGAPDRFGESAGCIRLRPDDASFVFDFLAVGDEVSVIS